MTDSKALRIARAVCEYAARLDVDWPAKAELLGNFAVAQGVDGEGWNELIFVSGATQDICPEDGTN